VSTKQWIQTRWSLLSRLKEWRDDGSWQDFFDTYWHLIYRTAIKAGLNEEEAQDVVQETLVSVAKNIADFKRDPSHGPFKGWLLHTARWKITDQFRKRPAQPKPAVPKSPPSETATEEPVPNTEHPGFEAIWDEEWHNNLMSAALEKVKQKVSPQEVQIFDLCVLRGVPVKKVATTLDLKLWKVYFAQKRVSRLLQKEIKRLESAML